MVIETDLRLCPHCGGEMDALTPVNQEVDHIKPGDFALCFYCAALLIFINNRGGFRLVSYDEVKDLATHHRQTFATIAKAQSAILSRLKAPPSDRRERQRTYTPPKPF